MNLSEWKWNTGDGLEMYSKAWEPSGRAKCVVCLVHGVGEHIGRYEEDAKALTGSGYILAGFDQRGFGKSGGRRGHTPSLEAYFDDIDLFLGEVSRRYPDQPRFLYGVSMGANLVLVYTPLRHPAVTGVIAASPAMKTALQDQKAKVLIAKLLGNIVPTLTLNSGVNPQLLSRDPQTAVEYTNDPLVHFHVTACWGKSMLESIPLAQENMPRFPLPLLLMHGTRDELNYPSGSQALAELAPKDKITLRLWDGFKHELHTDPEKAEVFRVMLDWMDRQIEGK